MTRNKKPVFTVLESSVGSKSAQCTIVPSSSSSHALLKSQKQINTKYDYEVDTAKSYKSLSISLSHTVH